MYILADMIKKGSKSRFIKEQRRRLKKFIRKTFLFFNVKDFIFNKYICEIYILADIK